MKKNQLSQSHLSPELKHLVHLSMEELGACFKAHMGTKIHSELMQIRKRMVKLRDQETEPTFKHLEIELKRLGKMSKADLFKLAQGFTLMMEFMNICENAYRAWP